MIIELLIGTGIGYCVSRIIDSNSKKCKHIYRPVSVTPIGTNRDDGSFIATQTDVTYQCLKCKHAKIDRIHGIIKNIALVKNEETF